MTLELYPHQQAMIDEARAHLREGARSVLIQGPTGVGKTVLCGFMLGTAAQRGKRALFIVHRRELVQQSTETFNAVGLPHGFIAAGWPSDPRQAVQICSINTLARRLPNPRKAPPPDLIVWDECHHVTAGTWSKVFKAFPNAKHIGLTATPERLDGQGLIDHFGQMVLGPSVRELIDTGYLCDFRYYAPKAADLDGIHSRGGDYVPEEAAAKMDNSTITGDAVQHYRRLATGKRGVVFACNRKHSRHIVQRFRGAGVVAVHIDGETPRAERDRAISAFRKGEIQVLSNVDLFGEGFDLPALEVAILLRPTQSLGLYLQQVGRALRTYPGKEHAIILDHAGNAHRFGLPDEDREWSLEGRKKKKASECDALPIRICPKCFGALRVAATRCHQCGHVFEAQPREIEEEAGELAEISPDERKRRRRERLREQAACTSEDELIELGKQRGYRNPSAWARYVWQARRNRKQVA